MAFFMISSPNEKALLSIACIQFSRKQRKQDVATFYDWTQNRKPTIYSFSPLQ
jgi:hypothetical protein